MKILRYDCMLRSSNRMCTTDYDILIVIFSIDFSLFINIYWPIGLKQSKSPHFEIMSRFTYIRHFDWYVVRFGSKCKHHKATRLNETKLHLHISITTPHSTVNTIRKTCVIRLRNHTNMHF